MGNVLTPAIFEVYLCDPTGTRIECLDYLTEYEYALTANEPGPFRLKLPAKFDRNHIRIDDIVEFWRGYGPGTLRLDYVGFCRDWIYGDDNGAKYTELYGFSLLELIKRRIVVAGYSYTGAADDLIKAIVKDHMGSDAIAARDLTSVGNGFAIEKDLTDGATITKTVHYCDLYDTVQEMALASAQAGTKVYFDIVPIVSSSSTGGLAFQLRTFAGQRGMDRTQDSDAPVYVGEEWGNLQNGKLPYITAEMVNYAYVLGAGSGAWRQKTELYDTLSMGYSIWNRREGIHDAAGAATAAERTAEGYAYLWDKRSRLRFGGDVVETPAFRYGRDWGWGDLVTAQYDGFEFDAMLDKIHVSRNETGETINARLEVG